MDTPQSNIHPPAPVTLVSRGIRVLVAFLVLGLTTVLLGIFGFAFWSESSSSGPTRQDLSPSGTAGFVSSRLIQMNLLSTDKNVTYELHREILPEITGINGYIETDGFHGDGVDCFEVELSPACAKELRAKLAQLPDAHKFQGSDFYRSASRPKWFPENWPPNTFQYSKDGNTLILPSSGLRAWFVHVHT